MSPRQSLTPPQATGGVALEHLPALEMGAVSSWGPRERADRLPGMRPQQPHAHLAILVLLGQPAFLEVQQVGLGKGENKNDQRKPPVSRARVCLWWVAGRRGVAQAHTSWRKEMVGWQERRQPGQQQLGCPAALPEPCCGPRGGREQTQMELLRDGHRAGCKENPEGAAGATGD